MEHKIISDGSDVEEINPPPIAHNQATSTDEAPIATASPISPQPVLPGQNALSFILNEEDVSLAPVHPSEVAGLSLPPPLPLLALDLRTEEI